MTDNAIPMQDVTLDVCISTKAIQTLQKKDDFCAHILNILNKKHLQSTNPHFITDGILMQHVTKNKQIFETNVLPQILTSHVTKLAHDELGHNGSTRISMTLKDFTYWNGLKLVVQKYVKQCRTSQQRKRQVVK